MIDTNMERLIEKHGEGEYEAFLYNLPDKPGGFRGWVDGDGNSYLRDTKKNVPDLVALIASQRPVWKEYLEGVRDGNWTDYLRELLPHAGESSRAVAARVLEHWDDDWRATEGAEAAAHRNRTTGAD